MAKRITDKKEFSTLVIAAMKRGVSTNCFNLESFSFEIEEGTLYIEKHGDSLFLMREREDIYILNFFFYGDCTFPELRGSGDDKPIVAEIPACGKSSASGAETRLHGIIASGGFEPILKRTALERPACLIANAYTNANVTATCSDVCGMYSLLKASLSPITGCVPTFTEFSHDVSLGNVLALYEDGVVKGVLRYAPGRKDITIKQLAVNGEYRRRGIGESLVRCMLSDFPERKAIVWTGAENSAALSLYEKCGFTQLDKHSYVYILK